MAVEESKRDKTFDEFKKSYLPHLEGKVEATARVAGRPETVPWNDGTQSRPGQRTGMSRASGMNVAAGAEAPKVEGAESSVRKSIANKSKDKGNHLVMGSTIHSNTRFAS